MERLELLNAIIDNPYLGKEQIDVSIREFILANTKDKNVRFNLFNFCNEKSSHGYEQGVYHTNGFKYGCLGAAMACIKEDYTHAYEHRIVTKKGRILDNGWPIPDYNSVKPSKYEKCGFDIKAAKELIKRASVYKDTMFYAKVGGFYFSIPILKLIVQFYAAFTPSVVGLGSAVIYLESGDNWMVAMVMAKIQNDATVVDL